MSADSRFAEPVRIVTATGITEVHGPHQAWQVLNSGWPESRAKWYHAANRACRSAMEGQTGVHVARRIFVEAAREARLV